MIHEKLVLPPYIIEAMNPWQILKLIVAKATATTLIVDIISHVVPAWGEDKAQNFILIPT